MMEQEFAERLVRIEEHVKNIDVRLSEKVVCCRHVTEDGKCEFYSTVQEHDKRINQWTGALMGIALISSAIGGLIGALAAIFGFKR